MSDNNQQNFPASMTAPITLYWTGAGWSSVLNNPYFGGTVWQFYRSPVTGLAGPANGIAANLTSLGIKSQVFNFTPPGLVDSAQGLPAGTIPPGATPRQITGYINYYNGRALEQYAADVASANGAANYIRNQTYSAFPDRGWWPQSPQPLPPPTNGTAKEIDAIGVQRSLWSGTTVQNYQLTIGNKANATGQAIGDSLYMGIPLDIAQQYGLVGQLSNDGRSVLALRSDLAASNLAYEGGLILRGAGIGLFGLQLGYDIHSGINAYQAGGAQFGVWLGTTGVTDAGAAAGAGYAAWSGAAAPAIATTAGWWSVPGVLLSATAASVGEFQYLQTKDYQLAQQFTYGMAGMPEGGAGVRSK